MAANPDTLLDPLATPPARSTQPLAWILALGWLLVASALLWEVGPGSGTIWAFDSKEDRQAFVFDRDAVARALATRAALLVPASYEATVLHIAAESCRCGARGKPHRQRIEAAFADRGVRFVTIAPDTPFSAALREAVPAAPAAVVLDRTGRVLYAGSYSNDDMCLPRRGEGAVERSLHALLDGETAPIFNPLGVGCLCPLPGAQSKSSMHWTR
ncbi:MAG: DUF6436 domain-containing protein [Pseudomonadota bacterium]